MEHYVEPLSDKSSRTVIPVPDYVTGLVLCAGCPIDWRDVYGIIADSYLHIKEYAGTLSNCVEYSLNEFFYDAWVIEGNDKMDGIAREAIKIIMEFVDYYESQLDAHFERLIPPSFSRVREYMHVVCDRIHPVAIWYYKTPTPRNF